MNFSKFLKKERAIRKMTQEEMSEYLKVPLRTYQKWEQGVTVPGEIVQASIKFSMTGEVK